MINCIKDKATKKTLPTTYMDISRIVINNVSMFIYDTPGQDKFKDLWKPYLKNQDGLIFVLDIADTKRFPTAQALLHNIVNLPQM